MGDVNTAIEALRRARDAKLAELRSIDQALKALGGAIDAGAPAGSTQQDFEHLGITAAARRYLAREGEPRSTREIADALTNGGLETRSKNYIATVYATLRNGRMFRRTKDGKWELHAPSD